jgi:hypothetical protein
MRMNPGTPTPIPRKPSAPWVWRSWNGRHDVGDHGIATLLEFRRAGDLLQERA